MHNNIHTDNIQEHVWFNNITYGLVVFNRI